MQQLVKALIGAILMILVWNESQSSSIPTDLTFENFVLFMKKDLGSNITLKDEEYHEQFSAFFKGITPVDLPQLVILGGGPGAGKTTFRKVKLGQLTNYHLHDMDEVLVRLKGYQEDYQILDRIDAFNKWWPYAQKLANSMVRFAFARRLNVLYDRTCGTEASYRDLKAAKDQGYFLTLYGFFVPEEVALERAAKRSKQEARSISENIVIEYRQRFSALWPYYLEIANKAFLLNSQKDYQSIYNDNKSICCTDDVARYNDFLKAGDRMKDIFKNLESSNP